MLMTQDARSCRFHTSVLFLYISFTLSFAVASNSPPASGEIKLRTGYLRPSLLPESASISHGRSTLEKAHPAVHKQWGHLAESVQYLLHLNSSDVYIDLDTVTQQIREAGVAVSSYIPDNTLLVTAQPDKLEALKQVAGVVWVGDYREAYKASPEAQRLAGWAPAQSSQDMQQAGSRQAAHQHSSQAAKGMHAFVRQAEDGTSVVVLDVFFPQSLSEGLEEVDGAIQSYLWDNASAAMTSLVIKPQPKFHPANAALADWQAPLDVVCHSQCTLAASGPGSMTVTSPAELLEAVLVWLTAQPQVHWVSPHPKTRAANFFATGIGQSGNAASFAAASNGPGSAGDAGTHPLWDAGLDGSGQIVGMGDTGIDWYHCTFTDSAVAGPGSGPYAMDAKNYLYWANPAHRKIVYYRQVADNIDENGHGTHCAGSAVGSLQSPAYTGWQGMAPQAKIAFQDLGSGAAGSIGPPDDLANDYYLYSYDKGARIHSDSWGTDSAVYDALAYNVDLFSFLRQDFLPIFAAGNFGYEEIDSTIASPSVSKNCLSVGASLTASYDNTIEQEKVDTDSKTYQIIVAGSLTATSAADSTHTVMLAYFGNSLASAVSSGTAYPLVSGVPADGCSALSYPYKLPGKVVLLSRGNCTFQTKVANAQRGGAVAALVYNNQEDGFEKMQPDSGWSGPAITMPSAFMPASTARPLLQDILAGASLTVTFHALTLPTNRWESLAFFSSVGPTLDGRFKPDIVTPGTTIASYSAGNTNPTNCALGADRGTSMATPVVAGAVALLRQYFVQGFYPTAAAVPASGFTPSGPLLKAVLLGGAVGMLGLTPDQDPDKDGVPLDPPPSTRQGFGRMQLSNSVPLSSATFRLQVVDKVPFTSVAGSRKSYKWCITSTGGPLKVTLVWHDPPALPSAATQLINDLDLTVHANSLNGHGMLGNGVKDRLNNVEQVSWNNLEAGLVVITVTAFRITPPPYSPQLFSLVVQGSFNGELESEYNPGWTKATTTSCSLPVAQITSAPAVLSNSLRPSFTFATSTDAAPAGFQCKLSGMGGSTTASSSPTIPLQDWTACDSPKVYVFTSPGASLYTYLFQVRATNFVVQDARQFGLLTSKPDTQISSSSSAPESFSLRSARFVLTVADNRDVTWQCRVSTSGTWDGGKVSGMTTVPAAGSTGFSAWQACTTPQEYLSLPAGTLTFQAQATDLAGNVEDATGDSSNTQTWGPTALATPYAIITGGTSGSVYVNAASLSFAVYPAGSTATYRCQLEVLSDATSTYSVQTAFAACTSPQAYSDLQAGTYRFSAMLTGQSGNQAAQASFTVDTTGPAVSITGAPDSITNGGLVNFIFASEAAASFQCRFVNVGSSTTPEFATCVSPVNQVGLADGNWVFQVRGVATSGVSGITASTSFLVDSTAPTISNLVVSYTVKKQVVNVTVSQSGGSAKVPTANFRVYTTASDGLLGSGVNPNGTCYLVNTGNSLVAAAATVCTSPAAYSQSKGTYLFRTVLTDQAGNAAQYNATILSSSALTSACKLSWYFTFFLGAGAWVLL